MRSIGGFNPQAANMVAARTALFAVMRSLVALLARACAYKKTRLRT